MAAVATGVAAAAAAAAVRGAAVAATRVAAAAIACILLLQAREHSPAIVFIDEVDAIATKY